MSLIEPPVCRIVGDSLRIKRISNGGWIVSMDCQIPGQMDNVVAAFSDTEDLLSWLNYRLKDDPKGPTESYERVGL